MAVPVAIVIIGGVEVFDRMHQARMFNAMRKRSRARGEAARQSSQRGQGSENDGPDHKGNICRLVATAIRHGESACHCDTSFIEGC